MPIRSNKQTAKVIGKDVAQSIFKNMLLVENQEAFFSWDKFIYIFSYRVRNSTFKALRASPSDMYELQEIAVASFAVEAQRLMDEYVKDKPLPTK